MSWSLITLNVDLKTATGYLRRIAEALEQIAPPPSEAVELKPDEAITYYDEQRAAERDEAERLHRLAEYIEAHPELQEDEGVGEGDSTFTHPE